MITYVNGNLFEAPAKVLVNTVNTVGAMGKGIALRFKQIYPDMFSRYQFFCESKQLTVGKLQLHKTNHKWILNFPTKKHWRNPSRPEYIEAGLQKFCHHYADLGITSIAFPALGCGNGELDYDTQVRPLMEGYLSGLPISVFIYLGTSRSEPAEHRDIKRIADWLRLDPPSLPFDEVWRDVNEALASRGHLRTIDEQHKFVAYPQDAPLCLSVNTPDQVLTYDGDELWMFWQQLRDDGLVYKEFLAEHYRNSFLMAIFELLPYVQKISVSSSASDLWNKPHSGLQIVPDLHLSHNPSNQLSGDLFHVTEA